MASSFGDAGAGALGGLIAGVSQNFLGSGLFGTILAIILTGSFLKGTRGTALTTVLGYQIGKDLSGNLGGMLGGGTSTNARGSI